MDAALRSGAGLLGWVTAAAASALVAACCGAGGASAPAGPGAKPEPAPAAPGPAATPAAAPSGDAVVADLNDMCGDLWCEGEWNYAFRSVACAPAGCQVVFDATKDARTVHDSVTVPGVTSATGPDGSMTEDFEIRFGNALLQWESRVATR